MAKKKKGMGGFNVPIVVFRTPEQHRMIIQPQVVAKPIAVAPQPKPVKAKKAPKYRFKADGSSSLGGRVAALGLRTYVQYLATPHWIDVKARWKASNMFKGWQCHSIGCDSRMGLSLHHWTYERVGREELSDLILVCRECHQRIHRLERRGMPLDQATKTVTKHLPIAA